MAGSQHSLSAPDNSPMPEGPRESIRPGFDNEIELIIGENCGGERPGWLGSFDADGVDDRWLSEWLIAEDTYEPQTQSSSQPCTFSSFQDTPDLLPTNISTSNVGSTSNPPQPHQNVHDRNRQWDFAKEVIISRHNYTYHIYAK